MMRSSTPSNRRAKNDRAGALGERACARLRQRRAARGHQQARARIVLGRGGVDRRRQHVGAHHHAGAAAGRRVVDGAMAAEPMLADLPRLKRPDAARKRVAGERQAQGTWKHFGKEGEDRRAEHGPVMAWRARRREERRSRPGERRTEPPLPPPSAERPRRALALTSMMGVVALVKGRSSVSPPSLLCVASFEKPDAFSRPCAGAISRISPAPKLRTATIADLLTVRRFGAKANEIGDIEFVLFRRGEHRRARHRVRSV